MNLNIDELVKVPVNELDGHVQAWFLKSRSIILSPGACYFVNPPGTGCNTNIIKCTRICATRVGK